MYMQQSYSTYSKYNNVYQLSSSKKAGKNNWRAAEKLQANNHSITAYTTRVYR